ncbi:hypothetical protein BJ912DRAFT_963717, partial [Pholiota molesta]
MPLCFVQLYLFLFASKHVLLFSYPPSFFPTFSLGYASTINAAGVRVVSNQKGRSSYFFFNSSRPFDHNMTPCAQRGH